MRQLQLNDPEYVAELLASQEKAERDEQQDTRPGVPVSEWSREVEVMTSVGQDVRNLSALVRGVFGDKKAPPAYAGPSTIVQRASRVRASQQHEALARRMVPHRYQED